MKKRIYKPELSTSILSIIGKLLLISLLIYGIYKLDNIYYSITASLLILLISAILLRGIIQLTTSKYSLIISEEGVYNATNLFGKYFISWEDVEKICVNTSPATAAIYIIVIHLKNPEQFIENQKGALTKSTFKNNYKKYGSPTIIHYTTINANILELENVLYESYDYHNN